MRYEAIVIGASAGGLKAFSHILQALPANFSLPILIVQHLIEQEDSYLAVSLNKTCKVTVTEAFDKEKIISNRIYTAPPGYHMLIENKNTISLSLDPPINYSRPSIDMLFETAAEIFREHLIGILLTGANQDGATGLSHIHHHGGLCIVQDPKTATASTMPQAAINMIKIDHILNLEQISNQLITIGLQNEQK